MADLAVNKVLAAGGRREVRDYADLFLIERHIMPLWHAIWAAPGKDEAWSPLSLAEKIAMTNSFRQTEIDERVVSTVALSAAEIGRTIRAGIEVARDAFGRLPDRDAGKLYVDDEGVVVNDLDRILSGAGVRAVEASRGGAWPSGPDIDQALVRNLIDTFGRDGVNSTGG